MVNQFFPSTQAAVLLALLPHLVSDSIAVGMWRHYGDIMVIVWRNYGETMAKRSRDSLGVYDVSGIYSVTY